MASGFLFFKQKTAYEITTRLVGSEMCIRDRTIGGTLDLDNSIYLGEGVTPRKTKQLVIRGTMDSDHQQFKWALQREGV